MLWLVMTLTLNPFTFHPYNFYFYYAYKHYGYFFNCASYYKLELRVSIKSLMAFFTLLCEGKSNLFIIPIRNKLN
jgi:hypothetical protein